MLVYRTSPLKGVAAVLLCAAFAYGGTVMAADKPLAGWAAALLFGGVALFALATVATGGTTLRVGKKGFELGSVFKRTRYRWDEIEPLQLAEFRRARVIALNYRAGSSKPGVSRVMTGMDAMIPNTFNVPLQELCDTMNEWRGRYLGASAAAAPAVPRVAAPDAMAPERPAPVVRLALGAAFTVLVLNLVARLLLKLEGTPATVAIAFGVGGLVAFGFARYAGRAPTSAERARFLWTYAALVVVPPAALLMLATASRGFNGWAWLMLALHCLPYPAAAQFFLSGKRLGNMLGRTA